VSRSVGWDRELDSEKLTLALMTISPDYRFPKTLASADTPAVN